MQRFVWKTVIKNDWIKKYWLLLVIVGVVLILMIEVFVVLSIRELRKFREIETMVTDQQDQVVVDQPLVKTKIVDKYNGELDWNFSELRPWTGYEDDVVLTSANLVRVVDSQTAEYEINYQGITKIFKVEDTEIIDRDFEMVSEEVVVDAVSKKTDKIELINHKRVMLVFEKEDLDLEVIRLIAIIYD